MRAYSNGAYSVLLLPIIIDSPAAITPELLNESEQLDDIESERQSEHSFHRTDSEHSGCSDLRNICPSNEYVSTKGVPRYSHCNLISTTKHGYSSSSEPCLDKLAEKKEIIYLVFTSVGQSLDKLEQNN
ncbi:hypothetical protein FQA39_LY07969 [Lamprigera yunnana]|nr:hypothetical protein FQA39_LY07969 [Lamprigera yunnana]